MGSEFNYFLEIIPPGMYPRTKAIPAVNNLFTNTVPFTDDVKISDRAKDRVYFMVANDVIKGTGNNMFSPRAATPAEEAKGYATATREQALVIAVRMAENLK